MAKRLTDCEKWTKLWFRKLSPVHKCFWVYVCDKCDHVGVWEVDFEMASLYIGASLDTNEIKEVFKKQFVELNCGSKWLIKDFLFFQYGSMDETNKMFKTIETTLKRYGLKMGDIWGINPLKVSVKEKVKVIVKEMEEDYPHLKDPVFKKTFDSFLAGRKTKATQHARELLLSDLHKHDLKTAILMTEQSIKRGWTGIFELKTDKPYNEKPQQSQVRVNPKPKKDCDVCGGTGRIKDKNNAQCFCVV